MNYPSMKKMMICDLSMVPEVEALKDNEIILVTPAGVLIGNPVDTENLGIVATLAKTVADKHREDLKVDLNTLSPGNDGYLALRNVQLRTGAATYNFEELLVFFDQIIGMTFGKSQIAD